MGKELVDFYTKPHNGSLYIYPIEYMLSNVYSFPVSFVLTIDNLLVGRIAYYGYEQRNALLTNDLLWFERVNQELTDVLDSNLKATITKLYENKFRHLLSFQDPVNRSILIGKLILNDVLSLKQISKKNFKLIDYETLSLGQSSFNHVFSVHDRNAKSNTDINYYIKEKIELLNENYLAGNKDKTTRQSKDIQTEGFCSVTNSYIIDSIIQVQDLYKPLLDILQGNYVSKRTTITGAPLTTMFNAEATHTMLSMLNLFAYIKQKEFDTTHIVELSHNNFEGAVSSTVTANVNNKAMLLVNGIDSGCRELSEVQTIFEILKLNATLAQMAINYHPMRTSKSTKAIDSHKLYSSMERVDAKDSAILDDVLYLNSISRVADVLTKSLNLHTNPKVSNINCKYYAFRDKYKFFKSYFKHTKVDKVQKVTKSFMDVILTSLLKLRGTIVTDMRYGCLSSNRLNLNSVIPSTSIEVDSLEKESVLEKIKLNFDAKVGKDFNEPSISLEAYGDSKRSYKPYVVLKLSPEQKIYFDLKYEPLEANTAQRLISLYNEMVYVQKDYNETYKSIMQQFDTIEKLLSLLTSEQVDKIKLLSITGELDLNDKVKHAILNVMDNLFDKRKDAFKDLTQEEFERLTSATLLIDKSVLNELFHRWYFLPDDGPHDEMILPQDYPYSDKPVNGINEHPFPQGTDKATREIPVDINILSNVIDFCFNLWEANMFLYGGFTPQQAVKHFVNLVYEWLAKYVPTKIDKIPEYYPNDYEIYNNPDQEREDYWRLYKWIRWYAEAIVLNVPKEDELKLRGNVYIKKLLEDLIKYFEDHHGKYGSPGTKEIDKIKGLRHKWLDKYKLGGI